MPDLLITSLKGGMNNSDPPLSLPDDQCVSALNVEWTTSMLGERRRPTAPIDLTGSDLIGHDRISFLYRHLPTSFQADAQLWALGVTGTSTSSLCYKSTAWHTVTPIDAITLTAGAQYQLNAQTLHGKLFLAYQSGSDRLHVWDGTRLRPCGLDAPAAPTAADSGAGGSLAGTRYYRVREVVLSGATVLLRSEPSDSLAFAPDGSHDTITVTKPADLGQFATHWELEAATVADGDYYRIARTLVGTPTVDDQVAFGTGYASTGVLSEDVGDYLPPPSARYLLADEDRLLLFGSFADDALAARVAWTPVYTDQGVGSDERIPLDPVSYLDLDTYEGGRITGAVGPVNGEIWVFKQFHIYKIQRSNVRARAYRPLTVTKTRGGIEGSMVEGVDQAGSPCVYFLDQKAEPCRIGADGIVRGCGRDVKTTWKTINVDAASVVARALFDDVKGQVHWWVATGDAEVPDLRLVLHVDETRDTSEGVRKGWAIWTGASASALSACMFSSNVDDGTDCNLLSVPFVALSTGAEIRRSDVETDEGDEDYLASSETKPYAPANILNQFGVASAAVLGKAVDGAVVDVRATRDFGLETSQPSAAAFTPAGEESQVIATLDALTLSALRTVSVSFGDPSNSTHARWELNQIALNATKEQAA